MDADMLECPVCGYEEFHSRSYIVPGREVSALALQYFGPRQKKKCLRCGTGFAYPYFSTDELDDYYTKTYWQERKHLPGSVNLDFTRAKQHYVFLFQALEDSRSVLDFGCGRGEFSLFLRNLFPDKNLQAFDKSNVSKRQLEEQGVEFLDDLEKCGSIDLFYSSHSLEHLPDLNESMERILELTSNSAFLFFEVPNVESTYVFDAGPHLPHTYMFCLNSFERLAERYALDILGTDICGITWAQKLRTENHEAMQHQVHLRVLLRKHS